MPNNRIFYATHKVGIAPHGSTAHTTVRGLQSAGITTTFNLTQVFEIGQLAIYENIEGVPDVEIQMEKVLDGNAPIYTLATQQGTSATLSGRSAARCNLAMSIYSDTANSATGAIPGAQVQLSGLYINSVGYSVTTDGNATETCSLIGNDKVWVNLVAGTSMQTFTDDPFVNNSDTPRSLSGSGGVNRREDVLFTYAANPGLDVNGSVSGIGTVLPQDIPGISSSGTNNLVAGIRQAHVASFSCNVDLGREDLFELGRRGPYYKFAQFPVQVTSEIVVIASSGDMVSARADGIIDGTGCSTGNNLYARTIRLHMCEGLQVNLGQQNKLSSSNMTGGDTGGGNIQVTYSYTNFNDFHVYHPADPSRAVAGFDSAGAF